MTITVQSKPEEIVYYLEFPDGTKWGTREGKPFSSRAHANTKLKKIIRCAEELVAWSITYSSQDLAIYEAQLTERKTLEIVAYKLVKMVLN